MFETSNDSFGFKTSAAPEKPKRQKKNDLASPNTGTEDTVDPGHLSMKIPGQFSVKINTYKTDVAADKLRAKTDEMRRAGASAPKQAVRKPALKKVANGGFGLI